MLKENSIVWKIPSRVYMKPGCVEFALRDLRLWKCKNVAIIYSEEYVYQAKRVEKIISKYGFFVIMLEENYKKVNKIIDIVVFIVNTPNKNRAYIEWPTLKQIISIIPPTYCVDCLRVWNSALETYVLDFYLFMNDKIFLDSFLKSNERIFRMSIFWYLFYVAKGKQNHFENLQFYLESLAISYLGTIKVKESFTAKDFHISVMAAIQLGQFVPKHGINSKNKKVIQSFLNRPYNKLTINQIHSLEYLLSLFGIMKINKIDVLNIIKDKMSKFYNRS